MKCKVFQQSEKGSSQGHVKTELCQAAVKTKLWHRGAGSVFQKLNTEGPKVSCPGNRKKGFVLLARREVSK